MIVLADFDANGDDHKPLKTSFSERGVIDLPLVF